MWKPLSFAAATLLLFACSSTPVKTQYFTLTGARPDSGLTIQAERWGVGPIQLPGQLQRRQIVSSGKSQQVQVASHKVWAEGLDALLARVIAQDMAVQLQNANVWSYPWSGQRPERQVVVSIETLSGRLGGEVVLAAKWKLFGDSGRTEQTAGHVYLTQQATDNSYDAYVATINGLVHDLATQIANAVKAQ